jgi:hypothetical protein
MIVVLPRMIDRVTDGLRKSVEAFFTKRSFQSRFEASLRLLALIEARRLVVADLFGNCLALSHDLKIGLFPGLSKNSQPSRAGKITPLKKSGKNA